MRKDLATGIWIFVRGLPDDATEESVAAFLGQYLTNFGPDRVSTVQMGRRVGAVISLEKEHVVQLLQWAFEGVTIPSAPEPLQFVAFGKKELAARSAPGQKGRSQSADCGRSSP